MTIHSGRNEKKKVRNEVQAALRALSSDQQALWGGFVVDHLTEWLNREIRPSCVAIYAAKAPELDLGALPQEVKSCRFAYPRVVGQDLEFHLVERPSGMRRGAFGIEEPDPNEHPRLDHTEIDLCLCPGLAFSDDGVRLGRGGGYYDRFLRELRPDALRVGVGYTVQRFVTLPCESHDIPMTHLVCERGVREVPSP